MKKLLFLPLIALLAGLISFAPEVKNKTQGDETSKSDTGQAYYFVPDLPIPSLKPSEAFFDLTFSTWGGALVKSEVKMSYNGINKTVQTDSNGNVILKVAPGKYRFQFYLNENYNEVYTDSISVKAGCKTIISIPFRDGMQVESDKPVIYVYPDKTKQVSILLDLKGEIGFTYPYYDIGWNFIADPDGTIHMNNKEYQYLFWDGKMEIEKSAIDWNEGFIVERDSLVPFFEENLRLMGLNAKEIEDYITYWCPRMIVNEKNYIHFMFNEEYNEYAGLDVTPAPDKMFRVFMLWTRSEGKANTHVIPQALEGFEREGFTVVEWGGAEMPKVPVNFDAQASN
jgi:hypothetical protein